MKLSRPTHRHLLAGLMLTLAVAPALAAGGAPAEGDKILPPGSGGAGTVTRQQTPGSGGDWTAEKMREAKPLPLPSVKGPPVPQQVTPRDYTQPSGSSSGSVGGPPPR